MDGHGYTNVAIVPEPQENEWDDDDNWDDTQQDQDGNYMWQSRVEIEHYSVAYFERTTVFEAL